MEMLPKFLAKFASKDQSVVLGPGVGLDCAVVRVKKRLLVIKSDPITFVADDIGSYLVQVNANDLATTGAQPRWLLVTMLLPEAKTNVNDAKHIAEQVREACRRIRVTIVGGHTEITHGLGQPILVGTLIGEVEADHLVTPRGAKPGNCLLLTKGVPIEATSILAREFPQSLTPALSPPELRKARAFLDKPGISILRDAQIALRAGGVTAMHDPTEGGLIMALWELAQASKRTLWFAPAAVPIPPLSARVCQALQIDPFRAIASGALLLAVEKGAAGKVRHALDQAGIVCSEIGGVKEGPPRVWQVSRGKRVLVSAPRRDEIARFF